jgi:expansin (peptidoglycan-binding protein)
LSAYADFLVQGDPESVRATGDQVVRGAGFTTVWDDHARGHARRGSVPLTLVLGAFVGKKRQAIKVDLTIFAGPQPGTTVVRLTSASSGWAAGAIGASRNKKIFGELIQELATPFGQAGTLLGVNRG